MPYKVTGSIVTYNNINKIKETVASILRCTAGVDFTLFVVDNASTDGTPDLIAESFPEVILIRQKENIGFGAGHNIAIRRADSKYHFVINPDIVLKNDVISDMCRFMDENENAVLLSPEIRFPDGSLQILGKRRPNPVYLLASRMRGRAGEKILRHYAMLDRDTSKPFKIHNASGCFMATRTEALKKCGGFDEKFFLYFEDCDLTRRMEKHGDCLYFPYAAVYHVWHRGSKNSSELLKIHIKSMLYYYRKWILRGREVVCLYISRRAAEF